MNKPSMFRICQVAAEGFLTPRQLWRQVILTTWLASYSFFGMHRRTIAQETVVILCNSYGSFSVTILSFSTIHSLRIIPCPIVPTSGNLALGVNLNSYPGITGGPADVASIRREISPPGRNKKTNGVLWQRKSTYRGAWLS